SRAAQVGNTTMSASAPAPARRYPAPSSRPARRSESCTFIWQPYVRTSKVRAERSGEGPLACCVTVEVTAPSYGAPGAAPKSRGASEATGESLGASEATGETHGASEATGETHGASE